MTIYTKWVIFFLGSSLRQIRAVRRRAELSSFLKLGWEDRDNKFLLVIVYAHTVDCVFRQLLLDTQTRNIQCYHPPKGR